MTRATARPTITGPHRHHPRPADQAPEPSGTGRLTRSPLLAAAGAVALVTLAGVLVGYGSIDAGWATESLPSDPGNQPALGLAAIASRNLAASALLYSGVVTGGFSTVVGLALTTLYVGATMSVGVTNSGGGALASQVLLYVPLEFGGLLIAAIAGLYPLSCSLVDRRGTGSLAAYARGMRGSLVLLAGGCLLVLTGAVVEALLIAQRR